MVLGAVTGSCHPSGFSAGLVGKSDLRPEVNGRWQWLANRTRLVSVARSKRGKTFIGPVSLAGSEVPPDIITATLDPQNYLIANNLSLATEYA
jgi:hypothetical protein